MLTIFKRIISVLFIPCLAFSFLTMIALGAVNEHSLISNDKKIAAAKQVEDDKNVTKPSSPVFTENEHAFKTISSESAEGSDCIVIGKRSLFLMDHSLFIHDAEDNSWSSIVEEEYVYLSAAFNGNAVIYSLETDYYDEDTTIFFQYDIEQNKTTELFKSRSGSKCVFFDESSVYYLENTDTGYYLLRFDKKASETEKLIENNDAFLPETEYVFANNKSYLMLYETDSNEPAWNHLVDPVLVYSLDDKQTTGKIAVSGDSTEISFVDYSDGKNIYYRTRSGDEDNNQYNYRLCMYDLKGSDEKPLFEFTLPVFYSEDPDLPSIPNIENTSRFLFYKYDTATKKIYYYDIAEKKTFCVEYDKFDYLIESGENLIGVTYQTDFTCSFYFMNNYSFNNAWTVTCKTDNFSDTSIITKYGFYNVTTSLTGVRDYSFESVDFTGESDTNT